MNFFKPLTLTSILMVSACVSTPQGDVNMQSTASPSLSLPVYHYRCDSGEIITTSYSSFESVTLQYKGRIQNLKIAVSASGARYIGANLEWWTKGSGSGSEGSLYRYLSDGSSDERLESCTEILK